MIILQNEKIVVEQENLRIGKKFVMKECIVNFVDVLLTICTYMYLYLCILIYKCVYKYIGIY